MNKPLPTRRQLMTAGVASAVGLTLGAAPTTQIDPPTTNPVATGDRWRGLKIGTCSYTFKQMPLDPTIAGIKRLGLTYVSIKDFHLPLKSTPEVRKDVADKFKVAGITPLSCGVVYITNKPIDMRNAFEYARDAGLPTIVCSPAPDSLDALDALVKEFDIKLAIHNHGPGDKKWPSPVEVWDAIQNHDPRIGLCIDVGHTARAGVDPAECIRKYHVRLYEMHMKDLDSATPQGKPIEVGRGALDIRGMFQAILDVGYQHTVSFEYEKDLNDPMPGLSESVGYVRGILSDMKASADQSKN